MGHPCVADSLALPGDSEGEMIHLLLSWPALVVLYVVILILSSWCWKRMGDLNERFDKELK